MKVQQLALAMGLTVVGLGMSIASAQATTFDYSFQGSNGYSATGSFTTKDSAPTSFTEVAGATTPFTTQFLQSLSLSVFGPTNTLLQSGASVANGTSSDSFLYFSANGGSITDIDTSTQFPSNQNTYYFLTNNRDPNDVKVGFGNTTFNLFSFEQSTGTTTFLASASSLKVSEVPEPNSPAAYMLTFGALGAGYLLKNKLKKQRANKVLSA